LSDQTGEFTPTQLAREAAPPPASDATGEFSLEELSQPTADLPAQAVDTPRPQAAESSLPDVTGEFRSEDLPDPRQGPVGHATGKVPGRMTSPATLGAYPPTAPQVRDGRYAMKRFHARGGMGEVWLAEDCAINRPVALKKIRKGAGDLKERFLLEAQITGQL